MSQCSNPFCVHTVARVERLSEHVRAANELITALFFNDSIAAYVPAETKEKMQAYLEKYVGVDFSEEPTP